MDVDAPGKRAAVGVPELEGAQTRTWRVSCDFAPNHVLDSMTALEPRRPSCVLSKLVYIALCRLIALLALLAHGDAAKDLEILAPRKAGQPQVHHYRVLLSAVPCEESGGAKPASRRRPGIASRRPTR